MFKRKPKPTTDQSRRRLLKAAAVTPAVLAARHLPEPTPLPEAHPQGPIEPAIPTPIDWRKATSASSRTMMVSTSMAEPPMVTYTIPGIWAQTAYEAEMEFRRSQPKPNRRRA